MTAWRCACLAALLFSWVSAAAQSSAHVYRIGLLSAGPVPAAGDPGSNIETFLQALGKLGYIEGKNAVIVARFGAGDSRRLGGLAEELVEARVDVLLAGSTSAAAAAAKATRTIPIVMASAADPVAAGLVASLSRPGGNVTGLTLETADLVAKRLEFLKEALPSLRRVAAFYPAELREFPVVAGWLRESEHVAHGMGMQLEIVGLGREPARWEEAFKEAKSRGVQAVTIIETPQYFAHGAALAQAALKHRLPGMLPFRQQAEAGALMSYGADTQDLWRRAADYVDRILKGARPAEMPIEQPTKFELVINLATAKALGIKIPRSLLLRADHLIEQ